jgi:hypothetical protein
MPAKEGKRWGYIVRRSIQALTETGQDPAYHSVSDQRIDRWSIGVQQFEQQMRLLRTRGFHLVGLEDLAHPLIEGKQLEKTVAVTFDDGYTDFLEYALPIIHYYEVPVTLFVAVQTLGGASSWSRSVPGAQIMSRHQLEAVRYAGSTWQPCHDPPAAAWAGAGSSSSRRSRIRDWLIDHFANLTALRILLGISATRKPGRKHCRV